MTRPRRYLIRMAVFVLAVAAGAGLLGRPLSQYFMGNPAVNGVILGILLAGIFYIFRQVMQLNPEVTWIERFRRMPDAPNTATPRLVAPMAAMLATRRSGKVTLSASALRTLLDGIGTRLEETRETDRYLIGLLVFLGLLGTFYGLLETVQSVKGVIGGLAVGTSDVAQAFSNLQARLQTPLGGMSTAFSASLFGLAGSLILGFLDLQAGLAFNRFYNDLEEWLSGWTRLAGGTVAAGGEGEASVPAFIEALLEQTADNLDKLQRTLGRGEESRIAANNNLLSLTERLALLSEQIRTEQTLLVKLAEQHVEMKPVLQRLADGGGAPVIDEESRGHLRNIEVHLARLGEELAQGRGDSVQEIRSEIRLLARTLAARNKEAAPG